MNQTFITKKLNINNYQGLLIEDNGFKKPVQTSRSKLRRPEGATCSDEVGFKDDEDVEM